MGKQGRKEASHEARKDGRKEGRKEGRKDGMRERRNEGKREGGKPSCMTSTGAIIAIMYHLFACVIYRLNLNVDLPMSIGRGTC